MQPSASAARSWSEAPGSTLGDYSEEVSRELSNVQTLWAEMPVGERLRVLKAARHRMAATAQEFAEAISPELARTVPDTLVAEVLPLLAAGRFLERRAEKILLVRRLGRSGLPLWLSGIDSEVRRVPFGTVLVIGPANYPLFLPGVQALQGLAAGNAVIWKPGRGGRAVALLFADAMYKAGLSRELLKVTDESVEAVTRELDRGVDKVFFTGSVATGRLLMTRLANTTTPCVAELSGNDAVVVLPSAKLDGVVQALMFGMRLNGSATCMAPRRVLLVNASNDRRRELLEKLHAASKEIVGVPLADTVRRRLTGLLDEARVAGASVFGDAGETNMQPVIVSDATAEMGIAKADIFAPVLVVIDIDTQAEVLAAQEMCPFGLTAAIFGEEREARSLAARLTVGTVSINDLIVSTADPRIPFGGRRQSGFGVTRGAEGLLEMTAIKVITAQRGEGTRRYEPTGKPHESLFQAMILASHARTMRDRVHGVWQLLAAGKRLKTK